MLMGTAHPARASRRFRNWALLAAFCVLGVGRAAAGEAISFVDKVKPIFDTKCVACHACSDAPSQLDLRSRIGIERGAKKGNPYSPRLTFEPNTLLNQSPKTVEQWREAGFFSVTEGGQQSLMGKMLSLGHANPFAGNSVLPKDFDGRLDSLERENYTPNEAEFSAYAEQFPLEGMPFGATRLTDNEYDILMKWLEEGAKFDNKPRVPTDSEQRQIDDWESFLNKPDNRSRLVARYIFEHYNPGFFYFDPATKNFFQLVRATTPPGKAVVPVDMENIRRRTSPVDGPFWYRLMIVEETPCVKQHENTIDASGDRLTRIKQIFYEEDWNVDELPGYSQAEQNDPLNTYAAIPAKSRYKYMLVDAHYHLSQYVWATACRGDLVVSAVQDRFWIFFEDPETSLYVNDAQYRADLAPFTAIGDAASNDLLAALVGVATFRKNRAKALQNAVARLNDDPRASIDDIWPHEMLTAFRNGDSAWLLDGAVGGIPKTAWVMDFPTLQRMAWQGDVSVDLFAPIGPGLVARDSWGHMRRDTEVNLLRFLPADARQEVYEKWYPVTGVDEKLLTPFENPSGLQGLPETEIEFKTDDPYSEFLTLALKRNKALGGDPINRPQPDEKPSAVEIAFRSIVTAGDQQEPKWLNFKTLLPEASFIRVDSGGTEYAIYTMLRDRDRFDQGTLDSALGHVDVSKDRVTIWPGVLTGYPNFMFRMKDTEVEEFAAALIDADTQEEFTAIVERWGIRRTHPEFWENINSVTEFVRRNNPVQAAVFDVNRYKNH